MHCPISEAVRRRVIRGRDGIGACLRQASSDAPRQATCLRRRNLAALTRTFPGRLALDGPSFIMSWESNGSNDAGQAGDADRLPHARWPGTDYTPDADEGIAAFCPRFPDRFPITAKTTKPASASQPTQSPMRA